MARMNPVLRQKINAALEAVDGDYAKAAALLGITRKSLYSRVYRSPDLRFRWVNSIKEPTIKEKDQRRALASVGAASRDLKAMEADVRKGLANIGLSGDNLEEALSLQKFQSEHFSKTVQIMGASIFKVFLELKGSFSEITRELQEDSFNSPEEEFNARDYQIKLVDALGKTWDRANKAALTHAMVKSKMAELEEGRRSGPKAKPGFTPVVNTQVNVVNNPPKTAVDEIVDVLDAQESKP
jgi:hypothetical protein